MSVQEIFGAGFRSQSEARQIETAAKELEAVFVTQLLSAMRKTVPEGGLFGKTMSNEMFQEMLDTELARGMADKSPFGLADALMKDIQKQVKEAERTTDITNESPENAPRPPFRRVG